MCHLSRRYNNTVKPAAIPSLILLGSLCRFIFKKLIKKLLGTYCFLLQNVLIYMRDLRSFTFGGVEMYCWKTININKDMVLSWLYITSFLVSLFIFSVMYIPFSIIHKMASIQEIGILYLFIALLFLPLIHSLMHVLPLIVTNNHTRLVLKTKHKV